MEHKYIDKEEQELIENIEDNLDEWTSGTENEKAKMVEAAKAYRETKGRSITVRLPPTVFKELTIQAEKEGLKYQTYLYSIVYKAVFSGSKQEALEQRVKNLEKHVLTDQPQSSENQPNT